MQSLVAEASQPSALYLPDNRVVAVNDLSVRFTTSERTVDPVRNLSFRVLPSPVMALIAKDRLQPIPRQLMM